MHIVNHYYFTFNLSFGNHVGVYVEMNEVALKERLYHSLCSGCSLPVAFRRVGSFIQRINRWSNALGSTSWTRMMCHIVTFVPFLLLLPMYHFDICRGTKLCVEWCVTGMLKLVRCWCTWSIFYFVATHRWCTTAHWFAWNCITCLPKRELYFFERLVPK